MFSADVGDHGLSHCLSIELLISSNADRDILFHTLIYLFIYLFIYYENRTQSTDKK